MPTKNSTDQREKSGGERLNVYSDLPIRGVAMAAKTCPFFLEPVIVFGFSVLSFILLKSQRQAIRDNLKVLHPELGRMEVWREVFAVIYEFACSIGDAAYVRCGRDMLTWEIENPAAFDELTGHHEKGAILLTAHMGNYDLAGSLFSGKFSAPVHSVRAPERDQYAQETKEKELEGESSGGYVIHFNKGSEDILGLELAKALSRGEFVAIQGDRVLFDVSSMDGAVPGRKNTIMKIPTGPFVLAQISGAPIFPLFVKRSGYRKYCVVAHDPFLIKNDRAQRNELREEGLGKWMKILISMLKKNHRQWLVFEPAFFDSDGVDGGPFNIYDEGGFKKEKVREAVVQPAGFWPSHIGAALSVLMIGGGILFGGVDLLGWQSLLFLIPALPVVIFLIFNFFGAITTLITIIGWSGSKTPWTVATIFLGIVFCAIAIVFCATGGWFLKAVSLPWLIWISFRSLLIFFSHLRKL